MKEEKQEKVGKNKEEEREKMKKEEYEKNVREEALARYIVARWSTPRIKLVRTLILTSPQNTF